MKKYRVYLHAWAGAEYVVEAENDQDAYDKAWEQADLEDCTAFDWDQDEPADVEECE